MIHMNSEQQVVPHRAKAFFMFMMFMWVASVSDFTSFNIGKNPVLMPIFLLILAYYYIRFCNKSYKPLFVILGLHLVWNILSYLKYGAFVGFNFPPLYSIVVAHIALNIFNKEEFLYLFNRILVRLCALSLIVWFCANMIGGAFVDFMRSISVIPPSPPTEAYSFIVGLGSQIELGIRRNIGFTWEPGRFACWCLIGLYVQLIINKFQYQKIKTNRGFFILLLSLLSTLSTTGYSILAILVLFYMLNLKSNFSRFFIVIVGILIMPTILGLSFMSDKISSLMDINSGFNEVSYFGLQKGNTVVCPQRFSGFYFSFLNFIHDFWLGFNQLEKSYVTEVLFRGSVIVAPSEGIVGILARYGIFVGCFFYYWLIKSSSYLSKSLGYKGKWMFFLFFMGISFSYEFWENCIFMYFYLCAFYRKCDSRYFEVEQAKAR